MPNTRQGPARAPRESSETPVLFIGGFGYGYERNERVARNLRELGLAALSPLAEGTNGRDLNRFWLTYDDSGDSEELSWLQTMKRVRNPDVLSIVSRFQEMRAEELSRHIAAEAGDRPIDLIAQSADALSALIYADKHPGSVSNLILVNPAGLVRQPRFHRAAKGVLRSAFMSRKGEKRTSADQLFETPEQKRRDRELGGFAMAASVALSDQLDTLRRIRSRDDPTGVAVVLSMNDPMIRPDRVLASLKPDDADAVYVADAAHGINGRRGDLKRVVDLVGRLRDRQSNTNADAVTLASKLSFDDSVPDHIRDRLTAIAA